MATTQRSAVIITALPLERVAVLEHLRCVAEEPVLNGSIYRRGTFDERSDPWDVVVAEIGAGNVRAAAETERVISHYSPQVTLFVGVAGAIKDLKHGDVVASTKVYGYESGKDDQHGFKTRPSVQLSMYGLEQRARFEAGETAWRQRIKGTRPHVCDLLPDAMVAPIAAGEKIVASNRSQAFKFLRKQYSDAIAVEMEGHGFLLGVHMNHPTQGIIVRGISDLVDDKNEANDKTWQPIAARHAAAFAFQVLAKFRLADERPLRSASFRAQQTAGHLPIPSTDVFVGRNAQLRELTEIWQQNEVRIVQIVADGGTGKTTLVRQWLDLLRRKEGGLLQVLQWSFYSQGTHREAADSTAFIDFMVSTLGIDTMLLKSSEREQLGKVVAGRFAGHGGVLVLDGLEPLQYSPEQDNGALRDRDLRQMLQEILLFGGAREQSSPSLVVLTTRWAIPYLNGQRALKLGLPPLSPEEGAELLREVRIHDLPHANLTFRPDPKLTESELLVATKEFCGHPLALTLLAAYLLVAEDGDLARRNTIPAVGEIPEAITGHSHARRVMRAYDRLFQRVDSTGQTEPNRWNEACRQLLRVIGIFDRPAEPALINALLRPPIPGLTSELDTSRHYRFAVNRLRELRILAPGEALAPETIDTHPLIREHFGQDLMREAPDSWAEAHRRLSRTVAASVSQAEPDSIEEMLRLYRAVAHGCRGEAYEYAWSVFHDRIQQGNRYTSSGKLGLIVAEASALAGFFKLPWHEVASGVPTEIVGEVLRRSGFCLRALGRFREASFAFEAAITHHDSRREWRAAADDANNYSVGLLQEGEVRLAVEFARRALGYAERASDEPSLVKRQVNLAWLLHYEGRAANARHAFQDAMRLHRHLNPSQPHLLSTQGQRYGEFLLEAVGTHEAAMEAIAIGQGMISQPTPGYLLLDQSMGYMIRGRAESLFFSLGHSSSNEAAIISLEQAERLGEQTEHRDAVARCLLPLATACRLAERFHDAARYLALMQELIERHGMNLYRIDCALEEAWLELARGRRLSAANHLARAKTLRVKYAPSYGRHDRTFADLKRQCGQLGRT